MTKTITSILFIIFSCTLFATEQRSCPPCAQECKGASVYQQTPLPTELQQYLYFVRDGLNYLLVYTDDSRNYDMEQELSQDLSDLSVEYNYYIETDPYNFELNRAMENLYTVGLLVKKGAGYDVNSQITANSDYLYNKITDDRSLIEHEVIPSIDVLLVFLPVNPPLTMELKQDLYLVRADLEYLLIYPDDAKNYDMEQELSQDLNALTVEYNYYIETDPYNFQLNRAMENLYTVGLLEKNGSRYDVNPQITANSDFLYNKLADDNSLYENEVIPSINTLLPTIPSHVVISSNLKQDLQSVRADLEYLLMYPKDAKNYDKEEELSQDLSDLTSEYNYYIESTPFNFQLNRAMGNLYTVGLIVQKGAGYDVNSQITQNSDFLFEKLSEDSSLFVHEVIPSIKVLTQLNPHSIHTK